MDAFDADVVFLTGAGASIPVGIPGMVGMVRRFKAAHTGDDLARKAYDALRRAGVPDDLEEVLQFCNRLSELRQREMTEVLRVAVGPRGGSPLKKFRRRLIQRIDEAEFLKK